MRWLHSIPPARRSTVRVVLDANLLVSAIFGGLPARAVSRASREEIYVSADVRREWLGVAEKLEGRMTIEQSTALKSLLLATLAGAKEIEVIKQVRICRDPTDDAYLSLACSADAEVLLTGDRDLLEIEFKDLKEAGLGSLAIVAPRAFLEKWGR